MSESHEIKTTCPYCGVGCGLLAKVEGGKLLAVRGDDSHPVNRGRTCRKPLEMPAAAHHRARATHPRRRDARRGPTAAIDWDTAAREIGGRLRAIRDEHGPQSIGFYISGQLLTEDYYAVNKLAKGVIGTNTVDSNSRLCMSSAVVGYRETFGFDGPPPGYSDVDVADHMLLLGTNAAACHPILWGRIADRIATGATVSVVDPRRSATVRAATGHLPVRPGGDLALLMGMIHVIARDGMLDGEFITEHVDGAEAYLAEAAEWTPERAAEESGVDAELIVEEAHRFATASRAMTLWSMGANQSTQGTRINRALHALCLLTGNIGRPGTGPLSITGQPNAMGGREVGGLAGLLPGYRNVKHAADRAAVDDYWALSDIDAAAPGVSDDPGLVASDLFAALESGELKAIWIVATNPMVSLPDTAQVRRALQAAELVVLQDAYEPTETSRFADYLLPAAQWPEKEGTMTNSERRISRVRGAVAPPGEALPDWEIFARVGRAFGAPEAFPWSTAAEVHAEYVGLTAGRLCDQTGVSHARLDRVGTLQWPVPDPAHPGTERLYESRDFPTATGRAQLEPPAVDGPAEQPDEDYPLRLTTGRLANHWHTMSRTGRSPALRSADPEPFLEIHPDDLGEIAADGELVRVRSRRGWVVLRARADDTIRPGTVFAPFHWGELFSGAGAQAVNAVTIDATDPQSRQPELKHCAVRLEPVSRRAAHSVTRPTRLVVVGGGPAAVAVLEEAFAHRPPSDWSVTVLCAEAHPPYDRIALSRALAPGPERDLSLRDEQWYRERGVRLALGRAAAVVDTADRHVICESGERIPYDKLVIATGSSVAAPPILGLQLDGVIRLRTTDEARQIRERVDAGATVAVVGGGLVGLEAAAALTERGAFVTVVHGADRLMDRQLDRGSGKWLRKALDARSIKSRIGSFADELIGHDGRVVGVKLKSGEVVPADLVVIATGVSPRIKVAARAGIATQRGIVVDDQMRTSAPDVWAVGECAEHDGTVYGTWAPIAEQARVAAADLSGRPAGYRGRPQPTKLKVPGIELYSCGNPTATDVGDTEIEEVVAVDSRAGTYRRLVFDGRTLIGAVLMGDLSLATKLTELLEEGDGALPDDVLDSLLSGTPPDPRAELVCSCKGVAAGTIIDAIEAGATTVDEVRTCTTASSGCGSCTGRVAQLVAAHGRPAPQPAPTAAP
ncbi:MAG: molybdopterin-dependent oxidoreductase [Solirubrobacteraceae bacterium]|nr:molybdopterin-dependent oxidoreductase [Solirubrobacteraceae bacterium]